LGSEVIAADPINLAMIIGCGAGDTALADVMKFSQK
jgi:hypothetical protein